MSGQRFGAVPRKAQPGHGSDGRFAPAAHVPVSGTWSNPTIMFQGHSFTVEKA